MASCDGLREREKLERLPYLHGNLPYEYIGKQEMCLEVPEVEFLGRKVELVDLTQGYGGGAPLWPGFSDLEVRRAQYHSKSKALTQWITHNMYQGTYTPAPIHVEEEFPYIDRIPIGKYAGKAVVPDIPKGKWENITPADLEKAQPSIESGDIVIIHTGWHKFYSDTVKYFAYSPGMNKEAADWLVKKKVKAVGVDHYGLDHPLATHIIQPPAEFRAAAILPWIADEYRKVTGHEVLKDFPYWEPVQRMLLTHGIMGWANVGGDVDKVVGKRCTIVGTPTKWLRGDASNVRLIAIVEK